MTPQSVVTRIRFLLLFFILALAVSGLTAIPLQPEVELLARLIGPGTWMERLWPAMAGWISFVHSGILQTARDYPFLQYGTDWLALGHVVIAIAFVGPLRDPVRNVWVVEMGMIACVLVLPVALILGGMRQIPFFWRLIDCSFGVFGIIPLAVVRRDIRRLEEV
jgi:hypothetical protein